MLGSFREPPRQAKRSVPEEDRLLIENIVKHMERYWENGRVPTAELACHAVYDYSFFMIQRRSRFMREALEGRMLTDLGAGNPESMAYLASEYDASEYVGVDRYHDYSKNGLCDIAGVTLVNRDMLLHLADRPDDSTNVSMLAIDDAVLRGPLACIEDAYVDLLVMQIARVVPPGGVAFGVMSPLLHQLSGWGFERVKETDCAHITVMEQLYRKPG
ncbi:MAG: hypothetical protein AB1324_01130 [Candidatus Micrarchaeota archaeon]